MDISEIAPWSSKTVVFAKPQEIYLPQNASEAWLEFQFYYREKPTWCKDENLIVAFHQSFLPQKCSMILRKDNVKSLQTKKIGHDLVVTGNNFELKFDTVHAVISNYKFKNQNLITKGLGFNLWRAPVDNDKNMQIMWEQYMVNHMCNVPENITIDATEECVTITCQQIFAPIILDWKIIFCTKYMIDADGVVTLEVEGTPVGTLPDCFPRVGMRFVLDRTLDTATWFGRGEKETYADCKAGYPIGVYTLPINDFYFPYVVPQETGNREDTRWFAIYGEGDTALCFIADEVLSFSALHYSQETLTKARHTNEIVPEEETYLCIDHKQNGLGSASWGAETLEKDRVLPVPFKFKWKLAAVKQTELVTKLEQLKGTM